jgi:hypothetical protein
MKREMGFEMVLILLELAVSYCFITLERFICFKTLCVSMTQGYETKRSAARRILCFSGSFRPADRRQPRGKIYQQNA